MSACTFSRCALFELATAFQLRPAMVLGIRTRTRCTQSMLTNRVHRLWPMIPKSPKCLNTDGFSSIKTSMGRCMFSASNFPDKHIGDWSIFFGRSQVLPDSNLPKVPNQIAMLCLSGVCRNSRSTLHSSHGKHAISKSRELS